MTGEASAFGLQDNYARVHYRTGKAIIRNKRAPLEPSSHWRERGNVNLLVVKLRFSRGSCLASSRHVCK